MTRRNQSAEAETSDEVFVEDQNPEAGASTGGEDREMTFDERVEAGAKELFAKWKAEELAKKGKTKAKPEKRKHDLPEGYIAPVAFRHALVDAGLAAESMSPVQIYGLVRKASSNGMPVKHFDREGVGHDELQQHPITGETITRPGLKLDEGLEWWKNRPKHQPGQPRVKKETAEGESADNTDDEGSLEDAAELAADEGFIEAE
jgi:hypothetical protein